MAPPALQSAQWAIPAIHRFPGFTVSHFQAVLASLWKETPFFGDVQCIAQDNDAVQDGTKSANKSPIFSRHSKYTPVRTTFRVSAAELLCGYDIHAAVDIEYNPTRMIQTSWPRRMPDRATQAGQTIPTNCRLAPERRSRLCFGGAGPIPETSVVQDCRTQAETHPQPHRLAASRDG